MKQFPSHLRRYRLLGLSLIELMISLTIGLILMIAIMSAYLGSAGASRMTEAQGRMNEDAQAALTILTQQLRMAGNNPLRAGYTSAQPNNPVFTASPYWIRGCDGTFGSITSAADIAHLTCSAGTNSLPDSIAISYEADANNTVATSGGAATDCLGNSLPASNATINISDGTTSAPTPVTYYVADNRFFVYTPSTSTTPSLYCKGNGGTAQPLVENVEDMQLLYGTAAPTGLITEVAGYLSADQIANDASVATTPNDDPTRWSRPITVLICVLIRSEQPVVSDAASARYLPCFENDPNNTVAAPDLRLRRAYTTTVMLRNRLQYP